MKILITGATGAIGPRVVNALSEAGYLLRTFSADAGTGDMFPPNIEIVIGDVTDSVAVESAMKDVAAVIHMAALLHIVNPFLGMKEKYENINVCGTKTVVEKATFAGVRRIVLISTIAVYGPGNGQTFDEESLPNPDNLYAQSKLAAEKIVLDARNSDGQPIGTVLRLGAVYGSRMKGNYERLVHALKRHFFIPIGSGLNRRTLVYDKDVGAAAVLAVSHPDAMGRVFNVTDGTVHTLSEIVEAICLALGRKPPRFSLPAGAAGVLVNLFEKGCRSVGREPPFTRAILDKYTEDIAVDGSLIQNELGFVPRYDLKTGWEETIQEMRK